MSDFRAELTREGWRIRRQAVGHALEMLPRAGVRMARIAAGLLRCRIVAEEVIEELGGRGRQVWGAPLGSFTLGAHTLGGPVAPRTLGLSTLGGRIHGPQVR